MLYYKSIFFLLYIMFICILFDTSRCPSESIYEDELFIHSDVFLFYRILISFLFFVLFCFCFSHFVRIFVLCVTKMCST